MAGGTRVADVYIDVTADLKKFTEQLKAGGKAGGAGLAAEIRRAVSDPANYRGTSPTGNLVASLIGRPGGFAAALRNAIGQGGFKGVGSEIGRALQSSVGGAFTNIEHVASHTFGHLKSLAGEVFKGFAVGAGIAGFLGLERVIEKVTGAIPELISKGREYAESIHTITIETGASSETASRLLAAYTFLGGNATDLNAKINRLATTIHTNETRLNALGVVTRDVNGNQLDQISIIDNLRHVFATLPEGPVKTEIALKSFGRNGATALGPLLHFLGLTDEQMVRLGDDAEKQGLILSESQIAAADAGSKSLARIGNAVTGLGVKLFTEVGPKLTSFFDGIANYITANSQRIADAISGVVAQIVGLVQGLLGIDLGSFSAGFFDAAISGSQWAGALVDDEAALSDLEKKLHPVRDATAAHNAAIDDQIKGLEGSGRAAERNAKAQTDALDRESRAIDKQVVKLNHLADVHDMLFRRAIAGLTRQYDAELTLLDAEDQRIARAEQAEQDTRASASADRDAARAKRDLAKAQVDLAEANAQYQYDLANPEGDPAAQAAQIKQDILSIADAQQGVRDAQQGIADANQGIADATQATADHARANAEEDRRAEIQKIKDYVATIESIVEDSENKKAALQTLKNREKVLRDEIAAAKAAGHTEEAAGLETKLAAVTKGETELTAKIKTQSDIDVLNARKAAIEDEKTAIQSILETRKQELADEVTALRESKQSQTAIDAAELQKQIAALKAKIVEDKKQLKEEAAAHHKLQEEIDQGLLSTANTIDKNTNPAFERARLAGIAMATDIKNAIGGVLDLLLGEEAKPAGGIGPVGPRSGGIVGALRSVVDGIGGLAGVVGKLGGALDSATGGDARAKILLVAAGWAALSGNFLLAAAFLGAAGIVTGFDVAGNVAAKVGANPAKATEVGLGTGGVTQAPPGFYDAQNARVNIQNLEALSPANLKKPYRYNTYTGLSETGEEALYRLIREVGAGVFSHKGYEQGGLVRFPTIASLAERGPEYVLSNPMLRALDGLARGPQFVSAQPGGGGFSGDIHVHVQVPWSNQDIDFFSREMAYRRRS